MVSWLIIAAYNRIRVSFLYLKLFLIQLFVSAGSLSRALWGIQPAWPVSEARVKQRQSIGPHGPWRHRRGAWKYKRAPAEYVILFAVCMFCFRELITYRDESQCLGSARICSYSRGLRNKAFVSCGQVPLLPRLCFSPRNQIKSNHFYCHITTAQVPWWVKFLRACSKQCKKNKTIYI